MRTVIVVVAALIVWAATISAVQAAPVGKPFLRGAASPADLADRIERSLGRNPDGTNIIDPELCMKNGSCASPLNYLEMFQESDPEAHLTKVDEIPGFLRTLQVVDGPPGEYWVACLKKVKGKRGAYRPVLHCLSRRFKPGEKAWVDTKTKKIVLASDCTNPVEKEVPPKACKFISVPTRPGDSGLRFTIGGPDAVRNDCIAVKRAGETEFENWWPDECADKRCDFSEVATFMGQPIQRVGSYVPAPGEHIFRVPASFAKEGSPYFVAFCIERGEFGDPGAPPKEPAKPVQGEDPAPYAVKFLPYLDYLVALEEWRTRYNVWRDTWITGHSDSIIVIPYGYRNGVATVYYSEKDVPPGMPEMYFKWGAWLADHPQE